MEQNELKVPAETEFINVGRFCCYKKYFVPSLNKYFLEHWEISKNFPLFVIITLTVSYFVYIFIHAPFLHLSFSICFLETLFYFLFLISYIQTFMEGPGYLPFYYPMKSRFNDPTEIALSGLVVTEEQEKYIEEYKKKLPPRTYFFHSARRIVLRPDHYCDWVASFIGKKNYKLFFLFNFYASLYLLTYFVTMIIGLLYCIDKRKIGLVFALMFVCTFVGFCFLSFTFGVTISSVYEISQNVTDWEKLTKMEVTWDTSDCISNWEEVFGSVRKIYTWFIPIGAFHWIDNYDLVYGNKEISIL